MVVDDFNHDGNLDLAIAGNDFGTEVTNGRYDALNGILMLGDGRGNFKSLPLLQSGIYLPGDARALVKLEGQGGSYLLAGSQNKNVLKIYRSKEHFRFIRFLPGDRYALITMTNGKIRRQEQYCGTSFLSQSGNFMVAGSAIRKIEIFNFKTGKRVIPQVDTVEDAR
jgi:hypothetical protein